MKNNLNHDANRLNRIRNIGIAAHIDAGSYGHHDLDLDRGAGRRRTFNQIGDAELAANILPRLEQMRFCWAWSVIAKEEQFLNENYQMKK